MAGGLETVVMGDKQRREAVRLLIEIIRADSLVIAVKAGARAEGFVLGLETTCALNKVAIDQLYVIFGSATEARLKFLTPI